LSSSSASSCRRRGRSKPVRPNLLCSVQLALKYCPYLDPYPLTSAYLTLFVRNMNALMTVLPGKVVEFAPNSFLVRDPDGNCVIVHDVEPAHAPNLGRVLSTARSKRRGGDSRKSEVEVSPSSQPQEVLVTKASSKGSSCCESQDSGRFSDSERGSSELDQCLERLVKEVSITITDYSESSDTDSDDDHSMRDRLDVGLSDFWCKGGLKGQNGYIGIDSHFTKCGCCDVRGRSLNKGDRIDQSDPRFICRCLNQTGHPVKGGRVELDRRNHLPRSGCFSDQGMDIHGRSCKGDRASQGASVDLDGSSMCLSSGSQCCSHSVPLSSGSRPLHSASIGHLGSIRLDKRKMVYL
jgi:hypothetical protein